MLHTLADPNATARARHSAGRLLQDFAARTTRSRLRARLGAMITEAPREDWIEDATDHMVEVACKKAGSFEGHSDGQAEAWLFRIAYNRYQDFVRHAELENVMPGEKTVEDVAVAPDEGSRFEARSNLRQLDSLLTRVVEAAGTARRVIEAFIAFRRDEEPPLLVGPDETLERVRARRYADRSRGRQGFVATVEALELSETDRILLEAFAGVRPAPPEPSEETGEPEGDAS